MRTAILILLTLAISIFGTGCGYLDEDILVDDESFAIGLGLIGTGGHGYGYGCSCGGHGMYRHSGRSHTRYGRRFAAERDDDLDFDDEDFEVEFIDGLDETYDAVVLEPERVPHGWGAVFVQEVEQGQASVRSAHGLVGPE